VTAQRVEKSVELRLFNLPHQFGRGDHFITLIMFLGSVRWARGDHVKSNKVVRCSAPSCLQ
jgi:hypothetical protein